MRFAECDWFCKFWQQDLNSHRMFLLAGRVMNKLGFYLWYVFFYLTCGPGCLEVITSGSHKESSLCCRMYQAQVAFGSDVQIWKKEKNRWHFWSQIFVVVEKRICSAPDLCSVIKSNLTVSSHSWTTKPADTLLIWAGLAECHWNVTNSTNKLNIHCLSLSKTFWAKRKNWQINALESESDYMCQQDFAKGRKEHWGKKERGSTKTELLTPQMRAS